MVDFNNPKYRQYLNVLVQNMDEGAFEGLLTTALDQHEGVQLLDVADATTATPESTKAAAEIMESIRNERVLGEQAGLALEAIINEAIRPPFLVRNGSFRASGLLWMHLNNGVKHKNILDAIPGVGRIELADKSRYPYLGTGFRVGPKLLMTNRHVAEAFVSGVGSKALQFNLSISPSIDMLKEHGRPDAESYAITGVKMIHPYWDMALLEVDEFADNVETLALSSELAHAVSGTEVVVIGYPAYDSRNANDVQNRLFQGTFGVKWVQPGILTRSVSVASFGKMVAALGHDCSTLGGNSGSAIIETTSGAVVGLHFGGQYQQINYCVPAHLLARDQRVLDAGVQTVGVGGGTSTDWQAWWRRADSGSLATIADETNMTAPLHSVKADVVPGTGPDTPVEVHVKISGRPYPSKVSITVVIDECTEAQHRLADADVNEGLAVPFHEENYEERTGYDPSFLVQEGEAGNHDVPLPQAKKPGVLATSLEGKEILHYQNFSLAMHAKRRLALFTASNVTREEVLRRPDASKDYSRKGLTGLAKGGGEKWFLDPRLDAQYQLPDYFFTNDRKAFDKGHLVRREDVAWGETYSLLRRANGDTYHVTNCSPQVADFNQSSKGSENWGALENAVFSAAKSERLCVFAGPVFSPSDTVFHGYEKGSTPVAVRVPSQYWKVVVCALEDGLGAFGFVLSQNLDDVQWTEMNVPPEFVLHMRSLKEIEGLAGVWFDDRLKDVDQFDTFVGQEIAWHSRALR